MLPLTAPLLTLFTDASSRAHAQPGHPERPERLDAALAGVADWDGDLRRHTAAAPASDDVLARVHTPRLIELIRLFGEKNAFLDSDTYTTPASDDAARRAVSCTIEAAHCAAEGTPALALVRPPGHHAAPDQAMGFCLYNNIAIAAATLRAAGRRVAVVDIDVHHGNGTQDAFYDDDRVLYLSLHQSPLFPGTGGIAETGRGAGEGFNVNLPLPPGTGHDGWLEVYDQVVPQVLADFVPDVVLVSLGFDGHDRDPLASLNLAVQTYHAALERIRPITRHIAVVLEGGYDLQAIRDGMHNVCAALTGAPVAVEEAAPHGARPWPDMKAHVLAQLGPTWCLR